MGLAEELESPQCMTCKHKDDGEIMCPAFPFGIPDNILRNEILHTSILDEQFGDFVYTKI